MGGYDGNARLADVWRSADGRQWHLVTVSAAFWGAGFASGGLL